MENPAQFCVENNSPLQQLVKSGALVSAFCARDARVREFSDNRPTIAISDFTQLLELVLNRLA